MLLIEEFKFIGVASGDLDYAGRAVFGFNLLSFFCFNTSFKPTDCRFLEKRCCTVLLQRSRNVLSTTKLSISMEGGENDFICE